LLSDGQIWIQRWRAALERTSKAERAGRYPVVGLEALVACDCADMARALVSERASGPEAFGALVAVARALERVPGKADQALPLLIRALDSERPTFDAIIELLNCTSSIALDIVDRVRRISNEGLPGFRNLELALAVARQRGGAVVPEREIGPALARWNDAHSDAGGISPEERELMGSLLLRWYLARDDDASLSSAASIATTLLSLPRHVDVRTHRERALMELMTTVRARPASPDPLREAAARAHTEIRKAYEDRAVALLIEAGNVELLELLASLPAAEFADYAAAVALSASNIAEAHARMESADAAFNSKYGDSEGRDQFEALFADHIAWKARVLAAVGKRDEALSLLAALDRWAIACARSGRADCLDILAEAFAASGDGDAAFDVLRLGALEPNPDLAALLPAAVGDLRLLIDDLANVDRSERPGALVGAIDTLPRDGNPALRAEWLAELRSIDDASMHRRAVVLAREGWDAAAQSLLAKMAADQSQGPAALHEMAKAYAALGDRASSLAALDRSMIPSGGSRQPFEFAPLEPEEVNRTRAKLASTGPDRRGDFEWAAHDLLRLSAALAQTSLSQLGGELLSEVDLVAQRRFGSAAVELFENDLTVYVYGQALVAHGRLDEAEALIAGVEHQAGDRLDGMIAAALAQARFAQADREGAERAIGIGLRDTERSGIESLLEPLLAIFHGRKDQRGFAEALDAVDVALRCSALGDRTA